MRNWTKRVCAHLLALLCLAALLPARASAAGVIDTDRDVRLTIEYRHDGEPVPSVPFDLYYAASVDADANFTLAGDFADYPVSLEKLTAAEWTALAETLAAYADRDGLTPLDSGKTDARGMLTFPNRQERLVPGLYLVVGRRLVTERYTYTTEPFLIALPNLENDTWRYDVTASPKHTRTENPPVPPDDKDDWRVIKIWQDDVEELRPDEVVIELLKDGTVYDTVRLNAKNNWRHTWKSLPKYHADGSAIEWRVTEQPLKRYTVRISRDGNTFLVVNTYNPQSPDEDSTTRTVIKRWDDAGYEQKRPDTITATLLKDGTVYDTRTISRTDSWQYTWSGIPRYSPDGTEIVWTIQENAVPGYISSIRETGDTFILTNTPEHQKLPQTGLLWWPVPVLAAAGLLLTAYNLRRDAAAGDAAELVLERLTPDLPRQESLSQSPTGEGKEEAFVPDYVLNPELPMPEREIDGQSYIGVLDIPALGLSLPIISTWSYPGLQIAPCRYSGSAYLENLVIAGHNYRSHFASLPQLQPGDAVTFTDMDGTVFRYKVDSLETLSPYAISDMTSGGWPLTLFTCTVGGQSRLAIRCSVG